MDCCKAPASKTVQLSEKPCCEVRISQTPETRPAVAAPGGPPVPSPRTSLPGLQFPLILAGGMGIPLMPVAHPPPEIDDPPLFLLNASLRR
ncbi:MAG TPA: hypothetical protein VFW45_10040 [Candidatus Polarisedimenticolia bacterium]|nr:hypothetical protein [Candidatus Polarisedimenticolia bacterium]